MRTFSLTIFFFIMRACLYEVYIRRTLSRRTLGTRALSYEHLTMRILSPTIFFFHYESLSLRSLCPPYFIPAYFRHMSFILRTFAIRKFCMRTFVWNLLPLPLLGSIGCPPQCTSSLYYLLLIFIFFTLFFSVPYDLLLQILIHSVSCPQFTVYIFFPHFSCFPFYFSSFSTL